MEARDLMQSPPLLRTVRSNLDWHTLRFPGEAELRREIEGFPKLAEALGAWSDPSRFAGHYPPSYLAGGFVATGDIAPALYRVAVFLKQILRLETDVEIHLFPTQQWLVDLLPAADLHRLKRGTSGNDDVIRIAISAAVAERLWAKEALFTLGRKLGRRLFQQIPLCFDPSAGSSEQSRFTLLARGLWRFQELSCDRIGLLCCQDAPAAMRAIVKAATGLPGHLLQNDFAALASTRTSEEEAMSGAREYDFTILRLVAIERFAQSDLYAKALQQRPPEPMPAGKKLEPSPVGGAASEAAVPRSPEVPLPSILSFPLSSPAPAPVGLGSDNRDLPELQEKLEPSKPAEDISVADSEATRRKFALHAALWLISQRDGVGDAEREALTDLFGPGFLDEVKAVYEEKGAQVFEETSRSLAGTIACRDLEDRISLLRDLIHVAMSAGRLLDSEHAWLMELAGLIDVPASQASLIAAEFIDPEFADYEFREGQDVEVLLDGEWMLGKVLDVDRSGDLKVEFTSDHDVLKLNPTADLIRPLVAKRA